MIYEVIRSSWSVVIKVTGDLNTMQECMPVARAVNEAMADQPGVVALDLRGVICMPGSFCNFLVSMQKNADKNDIEFAVIVSLDSIPHEMIGKASLDRFIRVFHSRDKWVEASKSSLAKISSKQ